MRLASSVESSSWFEIEESMYGSAMNFDISVDGGSGFVRLANPGLDSLLSAKLEQGCTADIEAGASTGTVPDCGCPISSCREP